jgi:ketosteroid isomerase-like protein
MIMLQPRTPASAVNAQAAPISDCAPATRIDVERFRSLMQMIADGWNRGDAARAASCFAEDAIYSGPPSPSRRGRKSLYEYFGGAKGRSLPMHMTWHNLVFDPAAQIGFGEYTFRYQIQTHGIVIIKLSNGLIRNWREYEVESNLPWDAFVGDNRF